MEEKDTMVLTATAVAVLEEEAAASEDLAEAAPYSGLVANCWHWRLPAVPGHLASAGRGTSEFTMVAEKQIDEFISAPKYW